MSDTEVLLHQIVAATSVQPPLNFSWFRHPGPSPNPEQGAALSIDQARACLHSALQYHLYSHCYCQGRPTVARTAVSPDAVAAATLVGELSAANTGVGSWQDGWELRLKLEHGAAVAHRHGLSVRVDAGKWRTTSDDPALGNVAALQLPKEARGRQPNFYIALSDQYFDADGLDALVRLYWNVSPDGAPSLVRHVTTLLNRADIPFGFKLVNDPTAYDRCDSAVLYLDRSRWADAAPLLARTHAAVLPRLRQAVPAFTKRLGVGLGLAEDPPDSNSFGLTRCGVVAEGLLRATEAHFTHPDERVQVILDCFAETGVDPDRPHLNPGSVDVYSLPPTPSPRRASAPVRRDHGPEPTSHDSGDRFGDAAEQIAVRICREAVWHEQRCSWIGADPAAVNRAGRPVRRWTSMDASLYSGTAGVAVFLANVAVLRRVDTRETALGAARHAVRRAAHLGPDHRLGLYTGGLGTAVAVAHVGHLLKDPDLVDAAAELATRCLASRTTIRERDVLDGDAGAIVALLTLRELLDDESLGAAAEMIAKEMLATAQRDGDALCWPSAGGPALTGFSHGSAGMAWALRELDDRRPDAEWQEAASAVERFERSWFDPAAGNWRDRRTLPGTQDFMAAWCHGAPGVILSRLCAPSAAQHPEQAAENDAALATTRSWLERALMEDEGDFSLCHGLSGVADILLQIGRQTSNPDDVALAQTVGNFGLDRYALQHRPWPCGTPSGETPSLMLGLSGIGWFLLRLTYPQVPSLLLPRPNNWQLGASSPQTTSATPPEQLRIVATASDAPRLGVGYRGRLTGGDVGALTRLQLAAGGFRLREADHPDPAARWAVGEPLRDRFLPSQLPEYADVADYLALSEADPYLWNSLPLMLAFGHEQAEALLDVVGEGDPDGVASRTGAVFSALLSTFDYLADETPHRAAVFAVESTGLAALAGESSAARSLHRAYQQNDAPAVRLVCVLFGALADALNNAAVDAVEPGAVEVLRSRIRRLFAAERASTLGQPNTARALRRLGRASQKKSVLPFEVLLRLACLVTAGRAPSKTEVAAAAALGRAICLSDDLIDLLTDLDRGAPSPPVVALVEQALSRADSAGIDDQALLAVVADTTNQLLVELASDALCSANHASDLPGFTHRSVARWVGWHSELDTPDASSAAALTLPLITAAFTGSPVEGSAKPALDHALTLLGEHALATTLHGVLGSGPASAVAVERDL